jgi:hypothetical protein
MFGLGTRVIAIFQEYSRETMVELIRQNVVDEANHFWLAPWPHPERFWVQFRSLTTANE